VVLTNAWLIDGTGAPVVENAWIRIDGDRIVGVGTRDGFEAIAGERVVDLAGRTVLPGLADMHVHLGPLPRAKWVLKLLLAHGVTTLKETGNSLGDLEAISRWSAGEADLPRVHISGVTLNGSFPERRFLTAGRETRALLENNLRYGVEFLKIHNWISSGAFRQIAETARERNLYLTGHVPLSMSSVAAIDGGMTILEHVRLHAYEVMDDPVEVARTPVDLNMMDRTLFWAHFDASARTARATLAAWEARRERFYITPTMVMQEATARAYEVPYRSNEELRLVSPALLAQWHKSPTSWGDLDAKEIQEGLQSAAGMARFIGAAHARGVRVLAGSDFGMAWVVPGVSLHRELEILVGGGLTPVEAVRAATGRAAEALRRTDRGTIRQGQLADLLIVHGNVAANVSNVRRVDQVILGGRFMEHAALMKEAARLATADAAASSN
jgi:cytosine/adenosine deaminase-related metal-dependent hydrolase